MSTTIKFLTDLSRADFSKLVLRTILLNAAASVGVVAGFLALGPLADLASKIKARFRKTSDTDVTTE